MPVPPDVHSTNIRGKIKGDDNTTDDSVNGLPVPLQFVINNEPQLPRNREQEKLVGSHAKRQSRAVEKGRNTMPVQRRDILQKRFNQSPASQSKSNVASILSKLFAESKVAVALRVVFDSDAYLTPESSYLASEDSEARSLSASPELDTPSSRLERDIISLTRVFFDTSECISPSEESEPCPSNLSVCAITR